MRRALVLLCLAGALCAWDQTGSKYTEQPRAAPQPQPQQPDPPKIEAPMNSLDAVKAVLEDAERIPPHDRPYVRYLWCQSGNFKAANIALNVVSRGIAPVRAVPLLGGKLLRVDARLYARFDPNSKNGLNRDVQEFIENWEELRFDPTFSLLVTKDNANFAAANFGIVLGSGNKEEEKEIDVEEKVLINSPPYIGKDGKVYDKRLLRKKVKKKVKVNNVVDFDVLRFNPDYLTPHLDNLQKLLGTEAPLVLDNYFMARVLHTVKNNVIDKKDKVWATIWGGLYYELRGIKRSDDPDVTDEDLFYQLFGIQNAEKLFEKLQSDQRAAMFFSGVTGKKRRVDFFNTPSGKAWDQMGIGSVTHDTNDQDIDVGTHPIMNLLKFKDAAREAIFVAPNGMHAYAIFNGNGKLLDEADINAVSDRTVPSPHSPKLQCAMSCMACHEAEGSNGWKDVRNDVKDMLGDRTDPITGLRLLRFDVVADLTAKDQVGAMNRLAGLYAGDFRKGIMRGRDDYAETILKASGPQGDNQLHVVKVGVGQVVKQTREYIYGKSADGIDAEQALYELGIKVEGNPVKQLNQLLPPEHSELGFKPEDPRLIGLKVGKKIPRTDWAFIQTYAASRVHRNKNKEAQQ